jgi:hypothetical protein
MTRQRRTIVERTGVTDACLSATSSLIEHHLIHSSPQGKEVYAKAYDRFRQSAWNDAQVMLSVDLFERHSTAASLQGLFGRLLTAARAVRRGNFFRAAKALSLDRIPKGVRLRDNPSKVFAENWLAYRYGWTPMYGTISSLVELYGGPFIGHWVEQSGKLDEELVLQNDYYLLKTASRTVRCKIKARVDVTSPSTATLKQYGLLNPLEIAWEIVPFSFVVDWFLPIGAYLEDMTSFAGLSLSETSVTFSCRVVQHAQRKVKVGSEPAGTYVLGVGDTKKRTTVSSLAAPYRPINLGLNPHRLLDSLSLLRDVISGRRR